MVKALGQVAIQGLPTLNEARNEQDRDAQQAQEAREDLDVSGILIFILAYQIYEILHHLQLDYTKSYLKDSPNSIKCKEFIWWSSL